jgi:3-oxoacyl-[acyl-carrier-protein] synthase-1
MAGPLYTACLSLICPVGLTPQDAAAALRVGISGFTELPYADNTGERIVGAAIPDFPSGLSGRARLVELLARGLESIGERLPGQMALHDLPVLLCTRAPDVPGARVAGILDEVAARVGGDFRRDGSTEVPRGPVAPFEALERVRRYLSENRVTACLIAAVDSLLDGRTLSWLDGAKRLKTAEHTDGLVPGEAVCVSLVSARKMTPSAVEVRGLGFAIETATVMNEEPLLGKGMAGAVRDALSEAGVGMHEVDFRLSDVAGLGARQRRQRREGGRRVGCQGSHSKQLKTALRD